MAKTNFVKSSGGMLPWLGLALLLVIADQFTKVLILGYYRLGDATARRDSTAGSVMPVHTWCQWAPYSGTRWLAARQVADP